MALRLVGKPGG